MFREALDFSQMPMGLAQQERLETWGDDALDKLVDKRYPGMDGRRFELKNQLLKVSVFTPDARNKNHTRQLATLHDFTRDKFE